MAGILGMRMSAAPAVGATDARRGRRKHVAVRFEEKMLAEINRRAIRNKVSFGGEVRSLVKRALQASK